MATRFAKELADPDRIEHAEANILHAAASVRSHHSGGKPPGKLRKHEFRKSRTAQNRRRKEQKRDEQRL